MDSAPQPILQMEPFAFEAAYLSAAIYDDEKIQANLQMSALQSGHIRIRNSFSETLNLVESLKDCAEKKLQLNCGEEAVIDLGKQRAVWDIYQTTWLSPAMSSMWTPSWRKWASGIPTYEGHSYEIVSDNRKTPVQSSVP